ncbi:MAG: response regulator transcription factor [Candidatus Melainabacteria bacterium]|nr:response regulator transcription factor [Candidatus Melainabacteria bacterium]
MLSQENNKLNTQTDIVQVTVEPDFLIKYNPSRKRALQLMASGWSNASIAEDLNFSTKNIESITTFLIRLAKIYDTNGYINPRARLVAKCYYAKKLKYFPSQEPPNELLTEDQTATLLLVAAGLSNKTTGKILGISEKTIESRLNNLFLSFGINTKANKVINPRLRLISIANARQNITFEAFEQVWLKTTNEDLDAAVNNPQELRETVLQIAKKLIEEAPKFRNNAHKQRMHAAQDERVQYVHPEQSQNLYTRLNPQTNPQNKEEHR